MTRPAPLTHRFAHAASTASAWHAAQFRKGTSIPYVTHLFTVATLVLEDGGTEDEAIGALLHDAIEDTPHGAEEIADLFGPRVAEIVAACTDADPPKGQPKPPWKPRKDEYIGHLRSTDDPGIVRVSAADKLANLRTIVRDANSGTPGLWDRFKGGMGGTNWYYASLADALEAGGADSLLVRSVRGETVALQRFVDGVIERLDLDLEVIVATVESALSRIEPPGWSAQDTATTSALALELGRRSALTGSGGTDPAEVARAARDVVRKWYRIDWTGESLDLVVTALVRG
jgi:hypothetical protein